MKTKYPKRPHPAPSQTSCHPLLPQPSSMPPPLSSPQPNTFHHSHPVPHPESSQNKQDTYDPTRVGVIYTSLECFQANDTIRFRIVWDLFLVRQRVCAAK